MEKDKRNATHIDGPKRHNQSIGDGDKLQYLLGAEEQILHAISAQAPLPGILNAICCSLDTQIGNTVSLISVALHGPLSGAELAITNANLFGLYIFNSIAIAAENEQVLGLLEMFCSVPRAASLDEQQLIDRAVCLAAVAIKRYNESGQNCTVRAGWSSEADLPWPFLVN